ncbi:hypothetical protein Arub01_28260 [Actinomadura rubrobrunea]|uniref:Uncharacterized protein n=1 Tax=Actinomadura rubrobrunea TaxID=115335 RepID=A0A9W6PVV0_9ACTN|nr:hypothetical protein [Actinomadura rubrobrunea]GLW64582.1 hypothetical protein Arub01_28260 [Actinomadura rubrobrunea]
MSRERSQRPGDAAPARESVHDPPGETRAGRAPQARSDDHRTPQPQSIPSRTAGPETGAGSDAPGTAPGDETARSTSNLVDDRPTEEGTGHARPAQDLQALVDAETAEDPQTGPAEQPRDDATAPGIEDADSSTGMTSHHDLTPEQLRERLRRRAVFLRELAEARELRRRVTPHRSRRARIHAALRRRTFRLH